MCGRVGLPAQCDASKLPAGKKLEQDFVKLTDNISYAAVIHLLSRFDGARVFTDKRGTFHYQLQQSGGSYSLNYKPPSTSSPMRADFLLLFIHRNVEASMGSDHHIMSWHAKEKKKYIGKSSVKGSGTPRQYVYHFPTLDQAHADQHAKARAAEVARHQIELRVTCAGDPTIDLMQQLVLTGTGAFDQSYTIDSITHEFGMSGHEMSITTKGPKGSGSGFSEDFFW